MSGEPSESSQLQLLKHVPDMLRADIMRRTHIMRAPKGRTLMEKGSPASEVFFLLEGQARVLLYSPNGREVSFHDIGPGDMFGEISVLDGEPRSATVVAASDLSALVMRASDFMACVESSPRAAVWLARRLTLNVRRLTKQVFELSALNVHARIHCALLRLAQNGVQRDGGIEVNPAPTHAELANRIGTHREAVTREMRALSDMNIIRHHRRKLLIVDIARLEQSAERWDAG